MQEKNLSDYLGGGYWNLNKRMVRALGIDKALWLSNLYDWRNHLQQEGQLREDDFFYLTQDNIFEETGISIDKQARFVEYFIENGILEKKLEGLPARNYYKINPIQMISFIETEYDKNINPSTRKTRVLDSDKYGDINIITNKELTNKELSSKEDNSIILPDDADDQMILWFDQKGKAIWFEPIPDKPSRKIYSLNQKSRLAEYYPQAEQLFDKWNHFGKPLRRHLKGTKIWFESIERISKALKKYTARQIEEAMMLYHKMLTEPENFILSANARFQKVDLNMFMEFTAYDRNQMPSTSLAIKIESWFDECVQGINYLNKAYGRLIKDEHPTVTAAFKRVWNERGYNSDSATPRGENNFRQASKALITFLDKMKGKTNFVGMGEHKPEAIVKYVYNAIDASLGDKEMEITTGWLCSRAMFERRFPDYLKENGLLN